MRWSPLLSKSGAPLAAPPLLGQHPEQVLRVAIERACELLLAQLESATRGD